jgi:hypothetical protein
MSHWVVIWHRAHVGRTSGDGYLKRKEGEQLIEPLYVQYNHNLKIVATPLAETRRTKDINKAISGRVLENTPFEKSQI